MRGILGRSDLAANTDTTIFTVASNKTSTFNISICNRNSETVFVNVALSDTATPADADYIEFNTAIDSNSVLERTGIVLDGDKKLIVKSTAANVSVVVFGFEE